MDSGHQGQYRCSALNSISHTPLRFPPRALTSTCRYSSYPPNRRTNSDLTFTSTPSTFRFASSTPSFGDDYLPIHVSRTSPQCNTSRTFAHSHRTPDLHTLPKATPNHTSPSILHLVLYTILFLSIPSLYFSRVARIADVTAASACNYSHSAPVTFWADSHIEGAWSLLKEWKTLNIISTLLVPTIFALLQIPSAGDDPFTRDCALLSLICAMMSLLYGFVYTIRFATMRGPQKAAKWAAETQRTKAALWWNVYVFLALPAVWLAWAIVLFITTVMLFLWRAGPAGYKPAQPPSPDVALESRIGISAVLVLGLAYLLLIAKTFSRYSDTSAMSLQKKFVSWAGGRRSDMASRRLRCEAPIELGEHSPSVEESEGVQQYGQNRRFQFASWSHSPFRLRRPLRLSGPVTNARGTGMNPVLDPEARHPTRDGHAAPPMFHGTNEIELVDQTWNELGDCDSRGRAVNVSGLHRHHRSPCSTPEDIPYYQHTPNSLLNHRWTSFTSNGAKPGPSSVQQPGNPSQVGWLTHEESRQPQLCDSYPAVPGERGGYQDDTWQTHMVNVHPRTRCLNLASLRDGTSIP